MVLCRVDQLTFHAAYITYHAGMYPIDRHLQQMCSTDVVFLFATWNRIGYHRQRLKMYDDLDCQVCTGFCLGDWDSASGQQSCQSSPFFELLNSCASH